jgi:hypothetical protein
MYVFGGHGSAATPSGWAESHKGPDCQPPEVGLILDPSYSLCVSGLGKSKTNANVTFWKGL